MDVTAVVESEGMVTHIYQGSEDGEEGEEEEEEEGEEGEEEEEEEVEEDMVSVNYLSFQFIVRF